jgi:hypothetical protein
MKRHADALTIEHIIELRARLAEAERQRDNALDALMLMRREQDRINKALKEITNAALKEGE